MAHSTQKDFIVYVRNKFPNFFQNVKVLEVGSLDINGSMRSFFSDCDYLGIDVGEGKGVDLVIQGQEYDAPDDTFDVCASGECFEHNPYWAETFANMVRMCKPGGLVFFTCATTGRKEHGTSRSDKGSSPLTIDIGWEYYQNLDEQDFRESFEESFDDVFSEYEFHSTVDYDNPTDFIKNMRTYINPCEDLYFWGIKK
jgi:SAM-dependent methyltransferase